MAEKTEKTQKSELIQQASGPVVVKIGLAAPFQIVGGDVFTFIDYLKHRTTMEVAKDGILCETRSKLVGEGAPRPKKFLVPWSNVTYVLYGE